MTRSEYSLSVKGIPGTLQDSRAVFATTHWSVVAACKDGSEKADAALAQLCRDYWPPLYSFVHRDILTGVQAFLEVASPGREMVCPGADGVDEATDVAHLELASPAIVAERDHGRFSPATDCRSPVEQDRPRSHAREGRGVRMTFDEEQRYEQSWATSLVVRALERIEAEFGNGLKARLFSELKPFLTGGVGLPSQEEVATRLDIPVETLRSHLSRLRARYRELLREEVARTIGVAEDVDEELHHLCAILTATC